MRVGHKDPFKPGSAAGCLVWHRLLLLYGILWSLHSAAPLSENRSERETINRYVEKTMMHIWCLLAVQLSAPKLLPIIVSSVSVHWVGVQLRKWDGDNESVSHWASQQRWLYVYYQHYRSSDIRDMLEKVQRPVKGRDNHPVREEISHLITHRLVNYTQRQPLKLVKQLLTVCTFLCFLQKQVWWCWVCLNDTWSEISFGPQSLLDNVCVKRWGYLYHTAAFNLHFSLLKTNMSTDFTWIHLIGWHNKPKVSFCTHAHALCFPYI